MADGVTALSAGSAGAAAQTITCELVFQVSPRLPFVVQMHPNRR